MQYRELGTTGISLSSIGFGAWTVTSGWWGDYSADEATTLIRTAYDNGITFFNTGNVYGEAGYGEKLVAEALTDVRDKVVIGTTFGYDVNAPREGSGHRERPHDWSVEHAKRSLADSLSNLGTDRIDIWQLHNPRMDGLQAEELWAWLAEQRDQGVIGAVGPSIGPRIGWRDEGVWALENLPIDFIHHIYNMLEQDPGREFNELAAQRDIGIIVRVPHSSGMLEGNLTLDTKFDANDHRSHRDRAWLEEGLQKVEQLGFLLEDRDATIGQVALKWLLADPAITSAQPNFYNAEQIVEYAAAPDIDEFDADDLGEIDTLYSLNFGIEDAQRELAGAGA